MMEDLWSVVLAAGQGRRLAAVTRGTPKQFWRADDRPSLLEETFERLAPLRLPSGRRWLSIGRIDAMCRTRGRPRGPASGSCISRRIEAQRWEC